MNRPPRSASPRPMTSTERLAARWHKCVGVVLGYLGSRRRATHRLERALELDAEDFDSQIRLGWIAFQHGDYALWRRCMQRAQTLSPVRFRSARRRYRFAELRSAGALPDQGPRGVGSSDGVLFETRPPRSPADRHGHEDRRGRNDRHGTDRDPDFGTARRPASDPDLGPRGAMDGRRSDRRSDDFQDDGERERFRPRRAIARDDIDACDFDRLIRRLGRLRDRRRDLY